MKLDLYRLLSGGGKSVKNLRLRGHFWCLSKWNISGTRVAIKYPVLVRNLPESGYPGTRFNPKSDICVL